MFLDYTIIPSLMFYTFKRFLNGNWHKTAWQIQTANSNNRESSSKFVMTCWCYQNTVLLKNFIPLLLFIILLHFRELYCNFTINSPSHTWLIILIRLIILITLKNNWMNACVKTEGKCNESVNNEFKIMRESDSLDQITRVSK